MLDLHRVHARLLYACAVHDVVDTVATRRCPTSLRMATRQWRSSKCLLESKSYPTSRSIGDAQILQDIKSTLGRAKFARKYRLVRHTYTHPGTHTHAHFVPSLRHMAGRKPRNAVLHDASLRIVLDCCLRPVVGTCLRSLTCSTDGMFQAAAGRGARNVGTGGATAGRPFLFPACVTG